MCDNKDTACLTASHQPACDQITWQPILTVRMSVLDRYRVSADAWRSDIGVVLKMEKLDRCIPIRSGLSLIPSLSPQIILEGHIDTFLEKVY